MIIVLANLNVRADSVSKFVEVAQQLVTASRAEPGCVSYELLRDKEDRFSFLERYSDEDAATAHRRTPHFRALGAQLGAFLDGKPEIMALGAVDTEQVALISLDEEQG